VNEQGNPMVRPPHPDRWGRWPRRNPFPEGTEAARQWSIRVWQRYASPVWMDIDQMDVINGKIASDDQDEKHICPLQLGVIKRCVHLWSNPGDVVFSPFAGVGSELEGAIRLGRKAIGVELKESYFRFAAGHLAEIEGEMDAPQLDFGEPSGPDGGDADRLATIIIGNDLSPAPGGPAAR
jgi:hypothetical protein